MDFILSIITGAIQGITEWLPISSSGQSMIVLMGFFGLEDPSIAFSLSIYLHIGTLFAVLVKMKSEVREIILKLPGFRGDKLVQFLAVSTIFTGVVGLPVYWFLRANLKTLQGDLNVVTALIGFFLILTGLMLYLSKETKGRRAVSELTLRDMVVAGIAQGFTILPGVSRSGMTIAVLLFRDFRQDDALKLSFLMSIPAVIGAVSLDILQEGLPDFNLMAVLAGISTSFIFGYLTIDALLKFAGKTRFDLFCIAFGVIALLPYLIITAT